MQIKIINNNIIYEYRDAANKLFQFEASQILHFKINSEDGICGKSPIELAKKVFEMAISIQEHGVNVFENGAGIKGVLTMPGALTEERIKNLRTQWNDTYTGSGNNGKTVILEDGMKFENTAMSFHDAEFLAQRKYSAIEICAIFGVPPHLIGDLERATFSNIEHQDLQFLKYTLLPIIKMIEQELNFKIFKNKPKYFAEFNINGFARADQQGRYNSYATGIQWGFLTGNEARAFENWDELPNLDKPLIPLNMVVAGSNLPQVEEKIVEEKSKKNLAFAPIFEEILHRAKTREVNKRNSNSFELEKFKIEHAEFLYTTLRNSVIAFTWQEIGAASTNSKDEALKELKNFISEKLNNNSELKAEDLINFLQKK